MARAALLALAGWLLVLAGPSLAQGIGAKPEPRPAQPQAAAPQSLAPALPRADLTSLPRPAELAAVPPAAVPIRNPDLATPRPKSRPSSEVQPVPAARPLFRPVPRPAALAARATVLPAELPAGTMRPKARPASAAAVAALPSNAVSNDTPARAAGLTRSPIPVPRPSTLAQVAAQPRAATAESAAAQAVPQSPRPNFFQRLFGTGEQVASAAPAPDAAPSTAPSTAPRQGSVCGDRSIRGEAIGNITSRVKGCGVQDAVRVTEVAGVRLSQAVTVECGTVQALKTWIDKAMRPAFGGREVVKLRIAAHYACRGRNNIRGARISEHGKGRALDIAGFVFADGTEWTIGRDYNKQIRAAHKGACGIFGTTLGPGSDGYHENHLHFDTAAYRSGPYCR